MQQRMTYFGSLKASIILYTILQTENIHTSILFVD